jgi:hypothetical protein
MERTYDRIDRRKEKAQSMVEFALTLPLLLVLVFGILEFGRLLFYYSAITTSSREAARYGSAAGEPITGVSYYQDCDGIYSAAKRIGIFAGVNESNVVIRYDNGPGTARFGTCPVGGIGPQLGLGDRIEVTISVDFEPIVPLVKLPPLVINSVTRRTIVKNVSID